MQRWRIIVLVFLFSAPVLLLVGAGIYWMLDTGWWTWFWVPATVFMSLAYYFAWQWQKGKRLLTLDTEVPIHWTDRDKEAWKVVEARAAAGKSIPPEKLSDIHFYLDAGQQLAVDLAAFYNPGTKDPIGSLTVPEILAVIELATHDLANMVEKYLPGGHLLTVSDWRRAKQVADWYQTVSNIGWLVAGLFSPINTGVRYAASHVGLTMPFKQLQFNLLIWFYSAFMHRAGTYLIDLHSGRLRVGARRYQELVRQSLPGEDGQQPLEAVPIVTITLMGQAKAGKSSLINALLGDQQARTDVVTATDAITRFLLRPEGVPTQLVIQDTVGYGHTGPGPDQVNATLEAACRSDLLLLVLHARNPGRQADLELLRILKKYFDEHRDLKRPPIMAVLTHIDLLSPAMEWQPPYDWQKPQRPKEVNIDQAALAVRDQLGEYLVGVAPVCAAPERVYGVEEWLMPALVELLDEARAVGLLRCLKAEADEGKVRRVFQQLAAAGKDALKILWQTAGK